MKKKILILMMSLMAVTFLIAEEEKKKDKVVKEEKKLELKKVKLDPNKRTLQPFKEIGYLVDIQTCFAVLKADTKAIQATKRNRSAYLAFVNKKGMYSFLETKANNSLLDIYEDGSLVEIKGKLLKTGKLIEIESINVSTKTPKFNLVNYKKYFSGKKVTLTGVNKCQCSLKVSTFKHDCKLGHLHHLQQADGTMYHYVQPAQSSDMKFHGKKVEVEGLLLPGNFISVTKRTVATKKKSKK